MGTGKHDEMNYRFQLQTMKQPSSTTTKLQCIAMADALKPTEFLALVTPEAKTMWMREPSPYHDLKNDLRRVSPCTILRPVDIPKGSCDEEVWELFDILTICLDEKDEVVLDITRGFRSQSMLVLMACVFLRVAKRITLKHVLYGAAEARDPEEGFVPIFDLSPFIYLINFVSDVEVFLGSGNKQPMSDSLKRVGKFRKKYDQLPFQQLCDYSDRLREFATSYALAQPLKIVAGARKLGQLHSTTKIAEMTCDVHELRAYELVLGRVQQHYEPISAQNEMECSVETLRAQYKLIQTYIRHGQELYAITLAREWLVSLACYAAVEHHNHKVERLTWPHRKTIEEELVNMHNGKQSSIEIFVHWNEDEALQRLGACYDKVRLLRNQTAHCGMLDRGDDFTETSISSLITSIRQVCTGSLREVAMKYGVVAAIG